MSGTAPRRPKKQHIVSAAYQRLWAGPDGFIAVIDKEAGLWRCGTPKKTLRQKNFITYVDTDGSKSYELEDQFGRRESRIMIGIHRLLAGENGSGVRAAATDLCAMHFARSKSVRMISERSLTEVLEAYVPGDEVRRKFHLKFGRPASAGELEALVKKDGEKIRTLNNEFAKLVVDYYNRSLEIFSAYHVQVVSIAPGPVTFVAADSPVVLSDQKRLRGTSSRPIPLGAEAEIWFPIGPRMGISFSYKPIDDVVLSPAAAQQINLRSWNYSEKILIASPAEGPHNAFGWRRSRLPQVLIPGQR